MFYLLTYLLTRQIYNYYFCVNITELNVDFSGQTDVLSKIAEDTIIRANYS